MKRIALLLCALACCSTNIRAESQTSASALGACSSVQTLNTHKIRSARVVDPFWILRWRRLDDTTLAAVNALATQPYSFDLVNGVSKQIEEKGWLPDTPDTRVALSFSNIVVENCQNGELDVVFHIFSAQLQPTASSVIEIRPKERSLPAEAAGASKPNAAAQIRPLAGYDAARNFFAGGQFRADWKSRMPFSSFDIDGWGSDRSHFLAGSLRGEFNSSTSWLGHADWKLDYQNAVLPVDSRDIARGRLELQFAAATRPHNGMIFRFGGFLRGGNLQSSFQPSELSADTIADTSYTSMGVFAGMSGRATHHSYAASYGLAVAAADKSFHGDWRRHVADLSHEAWIPFADHHLFEFEHRLTLGRIQVPGKIPVAERFFGGNAETYFVDSELWRIRSNPLVRSIPANSFYVTAEGAGADRFTAYNSTAAFTVWRRPVIPEEISSDGQFTKALEGEVTLARSVLSNYYRASDSHFTSIQNDILPNLVKQLADVKTANDAALAAAPPTLKPEFASCTKALALSSLAARSATTSKSPFGWVVELQPPGDNSLTKSVENCTELAGKLKSSGMDSSKLEAAVSAVEQTGKTLVSQFTGINNTEADAKAENDMRFVDKTLNFITKEMNITSISPLFIFDVAKIGPESPSLGGTRYAVGGGIRFTLVSTVSVNLGYAFNPTRRENEGRGAFFFSLTTRNLLE